MLIFFSGTNPAFLVAVVAIEVVLALLVMDALLEAGSREIPTLAFLARGTGRGVVALELVFLERGAEESGADIVDFGFDLATGGF